MARRRSYRKSVRRVGKVFRTRAGRLGRYVYKNGKRVAFETVKRNMKYGAAYGAYRTSRFFRRK